MRELSSETINKIYLANQAQRGTQEWYIYSMTLEYKYMTDRGNWSNWKYVGHGIPTPGKINYYLKTVKGITYIYSEGYYDGVYYIVDRYTLTERIMEMIEEDEG